MRRPSITPASWRQFLLLIVALGVPANPIFAGPGLPGSSQEAKGYACGKTRMTEAKIAARRGISLKTLKLLRTQRGLTPEDICAMPSSALARAINRAEHPKPDHPGEAVAFRNLQLQDENGAIPPDGLTRASQHINLMRMSRASAGITRDTWTTIGPGNIGGRVRSILIHPTVPSNMWIGSVSGGIWKTTDSGTSWQPVDDFMANLAVATLAMNPVDPNIMYAGTGEGFFNSDRIRGAGVFKSTDGGSTWTQLSSTANANWYYVNRLAIDPNNGQILLAATETGIWRSTDAGIAWTQVQSLRTFDVDFHPNDSNLAIAGGSSGRSWYSLDGGVNWTLAAGLPSSGRVEVAYARSSPTIVYASIEVNSGEIWRSTNGGQSYVRVNTGNSFLGGQGWYDNIVWVDPTNPDTLIVGGIDLWRSTNGGSTLTKISQWFSAPNSAHADHHFIIQHPNFNGTTNTTAYFGNDGGIYRASNVYTVALISGWQELNNSLGITQFYGAAGNPTSGTIVGGTQDNGTLRFTGLPESWTSMYGGDGGWCASDPTDPNYFYGEYVYLRIHRSINGGVSSSYIYSGITDAGGSANFISPFILDPNNSNTMLAGGASLWRSTNVKAATPAWVSIKASVSSNISAIAVAQGNSDVIWVGHNNGNVYRTTNGASGSPTWTQVDLNTPNLPNRFVTRLAIDPQNSNIVYATFGGFSADNVWRTPDGGMQWTDITGSGATGLPDVPVRSVVIHPLNSNWIYVGTEVGVFASENSGSTWSVPHDGPANVSVDELFWMNTTLVAATHGRGLFASSQPWFSITLSKSTYVNGDTLTATEFRPKNPSSAPVAVRLRIWLVVPTIGEVTLADVGSDGSFMLPANLDLNLGPISLFVISAGFPPKGNWEWNARITHPTTGDVLSEDINLFVIQ